MVDRITPATTDRERASWPSEFGIEDNWPVFCEPFRQWVLEDQFPARPPGAGKGRRQFVDDVAPFELMKIRILNGGHATIAYPAGLMDIHFVHEAMAGAAGARLPGQARARGDHPDRAAGAGHRSARTITSSSSSASPTRRSATPSARLCLDGSNRQPKFIIPSIADRLKAGESVTGLALVSALWCRYCAGTTDSGRPIAVADPNADRIVPAAAGRQERSAIFLAMREIFGDVADAPAFQKAFATALGSLWRDGTAATLRRYMDGRLS